jgi:hypothetical protein
VASVQRAVRRALFALCLSVSVLGGGLCFVMPGLHAALGDYLPPLRWRNVMFDHMRRAVDLVDWLPDGANPTSIEYRSAADWLPVPSLGYGEARVAILHSRFPFLLRVWCRQRPELEGVLWRTRHYDLEATQRSTTLEPSWQRLERCRKRKLIALDTQ